MSEVAGTTRDIVDAQLIRGNQTYRFIDTAGIRKRGKVNYGPEFFMVNRFASVLTTHSMQTIQCFVILY